MKFILFPLFLDYHVTKSLDLHIQFLQIMSRQRLRINPNPHCFIAITKDKACGFPTPCTALWGEGEGGCYFYGSEDLLNKNVSYTYINIKSKDLFSFL
jgi:hypothetical protein